MAVTVMLAKEELNNLIELYPNHNELLEVLASRMAPMKAEEMVQMLIYFDEIDNEYGNAPDSDFVEALAYEVGTSPEEVDRFWKYLAMGDCDAEWED